MNKSTNNHRTSLIASAFLVLIVCQIATCAPAIDYDNLRSLIELFARQEAGGDQFVHQMERKGGRSPSLRLRFGRRSDPLWSKMNAAMGNNDDNLPDKASILSSYN